MNNERLLAILAVLPDPDFIGSARLDARLGSNTAYKASTVAQLMERSAQAERDMWLQLCTELLDTELGEVACTGSDAPCEDVLGRIKAMVTRHTDAPVVRQLNDSTVQATHLIQSSGHADFLLQETSERRFWPIHFSAGKPAASSHIRKNCQALKSSQRVVLEAVEDGDHDLALEWITRMQSQLRGLHQMLTQAKLNGVDDKA